jgi:hypothetical protein
VKASDRSRLFRVYNAARHAVSMGRLERRRLDRALGLALRKDQTPRYHTTLRDCSCRDREIHPSVWCKHMISLALRRRAEAK